jgi:ankyrin repeat protein
VIDISDSDRQAFRKWQRRFFYLTSEGQLKRALDHGQIPFAAILIEQGHGSGLLARAAYTRNNKQVKDLIAAGADLDEETRTQNPPLSAAARAGNFAAAKMLIDAGCDINVQNEYRDTPLIFASHGGYGTIVDLLLQHGADPTVRGNEGRTALSAAQKKARPYAARLEAYQREWHAAQEQARPRLLLPAPAAAGIPAPESAAQDNGWSSVTGPGCDMVIQTIQDAASGTRIKNIFDFAANRFITELGNGSAPPQILLAKLDDAAPALLAEAKRRRGRPEAGLT